MSKRAQNASITIRDDNCILKRAEMIASKINTDEISIIKTRVISYTVPYGYISHTGPGALKLSTLTLRFPLNVAIFEKSSKIDC